MFLSLPGLAAVVACALSFAGLDTLRKALTTRMTPLPLLVFMTFGAVPLFAAWWGIVGGGLTDAGYLPPALGSVVLNVGANLLMLHAVRVSPLSLTIPLLSLTPVFSSLVAVPVLGETLTGRQSVGIALVVAGALALHLGSGPAGARRPLPGALLRAFLREPGSVMIVGVALLWSLAMPLDKLALRHAALPFHGLFLNLGVGVGCLLVLAAQGRLADLGSARGNVGVLGATVALSAAALGFQLLAIGLLPVGIVETLKRGIGNLSAILLGRLAFHEPVTTGKLVAAGLMAAGVALVVG